MPYGGVYATSLALVGVGIAPDVFVVAACGAITFFGLTYGNLIWGALMQVAVPPEMLGRASSADWLFSVASRHSASSSPGCSQARSECGKRCWSVRDCLRRPASSFSRRAFATRTGRTISRCR
jgi:hypothetical protein